MILSEDEYLKKAHKKKEKDLLDPDYIFAGEKAKQKTEVVVGYGKTNPNIAKKKIGKKNKALVTQNI